MMKRAILTILFGAFGICMQAQIAGVPQAHLDIESDLSNGLLMGYLASLELENRNVKVKGNAKKVKPKKALSLIYTHCSSCHRPDGNGPFSLTNYKEIHAKRWTIRAVVANGIMPPWLANVGEHRFINEPAITNADRKAIISWVDQGGLAPKREPFPEYESPGYEDATAKGKYLEYEWDDTFEVYSDNDIYQCFRIDLNLDKDIFVNMVEYISSNNPAVHHVTILIEEGENGNSNPNGIECHELDLMAIATPIDTWTKGVRPIQYSDDFAYRIPENSSLLVLVHYSAGFKEQLESRKVRFYLSENKNPRTVDWIIKSDQDIDVQKDSIQTDFTFVFLENDFSLFGVMPHMHFLAKRCHAYAITPTNQLIEILSLNDWNYLWQSKYMFEKPIHIPGGSTLFMDVVYDNTVDNPTQPNDPVQDVRFGQTGNEEMLVFLLYGSDYRKGDEKLKPIKVY